jgi:hypothetical protein
MTRLAPVFWLLLVVSTAVATFAVKYRVQALTDQLAQTTKAADAQERELRVLNAEWAYLNRPETLAQMNQRFLSLEPIATKQLQTAIADIPMRPAPVPAAPAPAAPPAAAALVAVAVAEPAPPEVPPPGNSLPGNSLPGNSLPGNSLPGNSPAVTTVSLEQPATAAEAAKPTRIAAYGSTSLRRSAKSDAGRSPGTRSTGGSLDGRSLDLLIERVAAGR